MVFPRAERIAIEGEESSENDLVGQKRDTFSITSIKTEMI